MSRLLNTIRRSARRQNKQKRRRQKQSRGLWSQLSLEKLQSRDMMAGDLAFTETELLTETTDIAVVNPGFEDISGETSVGTFNHLTIGEFNGWDWYDPNNIAEGSNQFAIGTIRPQENPDVPGTFLYFFDGAPEGKRVGLAFACNAVGDQGEYGMQQTLGDTLQANTTYELSVDIGNIATGELALGRILGVCRPTAGRRRRDRRRLQDGWSNGRRLLRSVRQGLRKRGKSARA